MTIINNTGPISNNEFITTIDPIDALIAYINDIKPYHSKIVETNVEYTYTEITNTLMSETLLFTWSMTIDNATAGPDTSTLTVPGDETQKLSGGTIITIQGSSGDDGIYEVVSLTFNGSQTQIIISGTFGATGSIGGTLSYTIQIV